MRRDLSNDKESVNEMQRSDDRDQRRQATDPGRDRSSSGAANARATTHSKPPTRHAWRSLILGWTDPESGDELTVDVRGGDEFARSLAGVGFEILAEPDPGEDSQARGGPIDVVAHRKPAGASRQVGDRFVKLARPMLRGRRSAPPN